MYNNVLQSIDHVAVWPIISFFIFFVFFISLLWWVFTADRKMIERMKQMPFDETSPDHNIKPREV